MGRKKFFLAAPLGFFAFTDMAAGGARRAAAVVELTSDNSSAKVGSEGMRGAGHHQDLVGRSVQCVLALRGWRSGRESREP